MPVTPMDKNGAVEPLLSFRSLENIWDDEIEALEDFFRHIYLRNSDNVLYI
jgi:hypothetical protein